MLRAVGWERGDPRHGVHVRSRVGMDPRYAECERCSCSICYHVQSAMPFAFADTAASMGQVWIGADALYQAMQNQNQRRHVRSLHVPLDVQAPRLRLPRLPLRALPRLPLRAHWHRQRGDSMNGVHAPSLAGTASRFAECERRYYSVCCRVRWIIPSAFVQILQHRRKICG